MAQEHLAAATGRRKNAVAYVRLFPGEGTIWINSRAINEYFPSDALRNFIVQPFALTAMQEKFDVRVEASGGGISGQAGATRHGIARALTLADPSLRAVLKSSGCLTRDPRMKERKKPGQPGARKRFQFSKR